MSEKKRIVKLERDVERLETALVVVAQHVPNVRHAHGIWSYRKPRSGPLGVIWKRVQKRSQGG